jgi:hypothetical protein
MFHLIDHDILMLAFNERVGLIGLYVKDGQVMAIYQLKEPVEFLEIEGWI